MVRRRVIDGCRWCSRGSVSFAVLFLVGWGSSAATSLGAESDSLAGHARGVIARIHEVRHERGTHDGPVDAERKWGHFLKPGPPAPSPSSPDQPFPSPDPGRLDLFPTRLVLDRSGCCVVVHGKKYGIGDQLLIGWRVVLISQKYVALGNGRSTVTIRVRRSHTSNPGKPKPPLGHGRR